MGERETKVNNMIKKYEQTCKKIEKKYDNTEIKKEISEIDLKLRQSDLHIEKLKRELEEILRNEPNQKDLIQECNRQISVAESDEERQELLSNKQKLLTKQKINEKEGKRESKKEINEQENKVRGELTRETVSIDNDIEKLKVNMKSTLLEMKDFKYEYKEGTRIPTNGSEYKKLDDKYKKQTEQLSDLERAKALCESKLKEFKDKDMQEAKRIQEALKKDVPQAKENKSPTEEELTAEEPTAEEPTTDEPTADEPTTDEPTTEEPTTDEPTADEPITGGQTNKKTEKGTLEIEEIKIDASTNEAYVKIKNIQRIDNENSSVEMRVDKIDIEQAVKDRKNLFKELDIEDRLDSEGINDRLSKIMVKRKINPVILEAIKNDDDLLTDYIESVVDKKEFPFSYKIDLNDSILSKKTHGVMNRIALKEKKIEGNEVKGTERLHKLKNLFRKGKGKVQERFQKREEPKKLGTKFMDKSETLSEQLKKQMKEQEMKYEKVYSTLTKEQQDNLKNMSVQDLQRMGMDYTTACGVKDKYGKTKTEEQKTNNTQEQTKKQEQNDVEL